MNFGFIATENITIAIDEFFFFEFPTKISKHNAIFIWCIDLESMCMRMRMCMCILEKWFIWRFTSKYNHIQPPSLVRNWKHFNRIQHYSKSINKWKIWKKPCWIVFGWYNEWRFLVSNLWQLLVLNQQQQKKKWRN